MFRVEKPPFWRFVVVLYVSISMDPWKKQPGDTWWWEAPSFFPFTWRLQWRQVSAFSWSSGILHSAVGKAWMVLTRRVEESREIAWNKQEEIGPKGSQEIDGFFDVQMVFLFLSFFPKATAKGSFEKSTTIKDCRSDGCLERLSSKTAEVITVYKDCHQRLPKWSLSLKTVIKDCRSDGCL